MTFQEFALSRSIYDALEEKGYKVPTPIQKEAIPYILSGRDVVASAETGTGKTAAFCIPILDNLMRKRAVSGLHALILVPTRELAIQVHDNLQFYGKYLPLKSAVIFGGVSQGAQVNQLRRGVNILVATPGRLLDLLQQKLVSLAELQILVLDEADRMLDMGFIHDVKRLIKVIPKSRQNIFFSATMPQEVQELIGSIATNPLRVKAEKSVLKADIIQSVYYVKREQKRSLLKHVIKEQSMQNVIVFARTKHGADRIAKDLNRSGISADALHGDKSQNARQRALTSFKQNGIRVLVATDIAARGIDIVDLPYVINYEMPQTAETYAHRIGRTGRAGQTGWALSFCDPEERPQLNSIHRLGSQKIMVVDHPFQS